jgi:hypothetical protein
LVVVLRTKKEKTAPTTDRRQDEEKYPFCFIELKLLEPIINSNK